MNFRNLLLAVSLWCVFVVRPAYAMTNEDAAQMVQTNVSWKVPRWHACKRVVYRMTFRPDMRKADTRTVTIPLSKKDGDYGTTIWVDRRLKVTSEVLPSCAPTRTMVMVPVHYEYPEEIHSTMFDIRLIGTFVDPQGDDDAAPEELCENESNIIGWFECTLTMPEDVDIQFVRFEISNPWQAAWNALPPDCWKNYGQGPMN